MKAVILAAGLGSRLRPLTLKTPKPLIRVGGKCLISYVVDWLLEGGVSEFHVNLHWHGEKIKKFLLNAYPGLDFSFYEESPNLLGTGEAIHRMLPFLGKNPFIVMNADAIITERLTNILLKHLNQGYPVPFLLVDKNPSSSGFGRIGLIENKIYKIRDRISPNIDPSKLTPAAFCGFSIAFADLWKDVDIDFGYKCYVGDILIPWLLSGNIVSSYCTRYPRFDVGTHNSLSEFETYLRHQSDISKRQ